MNQVLEFEQVRSGKRYRNVVGITPEGESRLYMESLDPDPKYGQKIRRYLLRFEVEANADTKVGSVNYIKTTWGRSYVGNTGELMPPIEGEDKEEFMITNQYDIKFFLMAFGMAILASMLNGYYRYNLGFNAMPAIDLATMLPRLWNEWQEAQPPTGDYLTNFFPVMPTAEPEAPEPEPPTDEEPPTDPAP